MKHTAKILALVIAAPTLFSACANTPAPVVTDAGTSVSQIITDPPVTTDPPATTESHATTEPPVIIEKANVSSNLKFTASSAKAWSYIDGVLVINNLEGSGDAFATSHVYIPAGTAFEFEATMQITGGTGNCGGITFGVKSPKSPSSA